VAPGERRPIEEQLLTEIRTKLHSLLRRAPLQDGLDTPLACGPPETLDSALRRLGRLIFAHLLPAPIQQKLAAAVPTDLVLRLDPQLVPVPWELAFDGQEFLLSKFRTSRQVVTSHPARLRRTLRAPVAESVKLLIIVDPTERVATARQEATQLHQALTAYPHLEVVVLGGKQLRKLDVLLALSDYQLVHFIGSTSGEASPSSRSGWVWPTTVLTAAEFAQAAHPSVLVFAHTCQAEVIAPGASTRPDEPHDLEVGSAFLRAGTPNDIGTVGGRHDRRGAALATDFYRHILHGERVGAALAAARQKARQEAHGRALLWASYVHYGNLTLGSASSPSCPTAWPGSPRGSWSSAAWLSAATLGCTAPLQRRRSSSVVSVCRRGSWSAPCPRRPTRWSPAYPSRRSGGGSW
jgi:hypothetical protein